MMLRELFNFDQFGKDISGRDDYRNNQDKSVLGSSDTRKTRLTLRQIGMLRRATDLHTKDQQMEVDYISRMYATPDPATPTL